MDDQKNIHDVLSRLDSIQDRLDRGAHRMTANEEQLKKLFEVLHGAKGVLAVIKFIALVATGVAGAWAIYANR